MVKSFLDAGMICGFPRNLATEDANLVIYILICDTTEGQTIFFPPNPSLPLVIVPPSFLETCLGSPACILRAVLRCMEMCISVR